MAASSWQSWAENRSSQQAPSAAPVKFGVISDLHFYDTQLGTSGPDWEEYLDQDPKLFVESEAILDSALQSLVDSHVKFVLVTGDMTKDGEVLNHVRVAQRFAALQQLGIKVFVVPGNHDINNPDAMAYLGETTRPVASVNPETFRALYHRFGYGDAIAHDEHSLSYLAEPAPGLWLLGIDSCKYEESKDQAHPVVSGRIKPETMVWILEQLQNAKAQGKQVIAFMHHGVNLHFLGEDQLFPDWLVDDWSSVSGQLANAGLKVIFTGHYHSQDAAYPINQLLQPQLTLCDVETASLVMYPCAFRTATLDHSVLYIESQRLTEIDAETGGVPFQQYAEDFLRARLPAQVTEELMARFRLPQAQAAYIAPYVVDALVANYAGDEGITPQVQGTINYFQGNPEPMHTLGMMLWGIWTDLAPGDNQLAVPLAN